MYPFKMFVFEGKDKKYFRKKHFLHFVEIFALFEGSLEFCIDNKNVLLSAGEFMIINSDEMCSAVSSEFSRAAVLCISPFALKNTIPRVRLSPFPVTAVCMTVKLCG